MYMPPAFRQDDPARIRAALDAFPFATLVSPGGGGLLATPLPLLLVGEAGPGGHLLGHVAKANPHWRDADPAGGSLAIFTGPSAYVSPSLYPSKAATGRMVPTWNYIALHVHGRLERVEEPEAKLDIVRRLTYRFEADRPQPWAVEDAPADYLAAQLRGIVGLRLHIDRVDAKWKISQNRQPEDREGVRAAFAASHDPAERLLALEMDP